MRPTTRQGEPTRTCPTWCRRPHRPGDSADDHLHQSAPTFAVVVHGDPRFGADDDPRPDTVVLRLAQRDGSAPVWLEASSEEGRTLHLLVSAESARGLVRSMTALLDLL